MSFRDPPRKLKHLRYPKMMKRQSVPKLIRNYKDRREPSISFLKIEIKTSLMFLIIVDIYNLFT